MEKVKHTVLMVSYNQEEYLPLALDSLFSQSELPYEVVISDDCSTDGTWNVIMEYYNKYPAIVKPIRNKRNLGVFGNINQVKKLPTGDIISWLSGDDLYKPGIFETFNEVVSKNGLNPRFEKFTLVSNAIDLYPDGTETIYDNYRFRDENLFKVKIRYGLNFRDTGFSIALWKTLSPILMDLGYHADWLYCIEQILNCNKFIFIDKPFPIYRIGVGVVSKTKMKALADSKIQVLKIVNEKYANLLDDRDRFYLRKERKMQEFLIKSSVIHFVQLSALIFYNWNNYVTLQNRANDIKSAFYWVGKFLRLLKLRK